MEKSATPLTLIGLGLSLMLPTLYILVITPYWIEPRFDPNTATLIGIAVLLALAVGVLLFVRRVERRPLLSIGWRPLGWRWGLIAVGIGFLLSLLVPALTLLTQTIIPPAETGTIDVAVSTRPWWLILIGVLNTAFVEEIFFRAYPLERLIEWTKKPWLSALISLTFFVSAHATGWNASHILGVVLPLGVVMIGLYLWRRNLLFVMIVHFVIDLPLVFLSLGVSSP